MLDMKAKLLRHPKGEREQDMRIKFTAARAGVEFNFREEIIEGGQPCLLIQ